ncbi:MAG: hypothetical protein GF317_10395 [Candidatus Lokiarchaeota archaeon]|nr:hypothetical protein [Candidatus Lokiarchaeota archaeon]MBD3200061.1 hypothetical protein [Candidatus Lokiarchaeota archaeon]
MQSILQLTVIGKVFKPNKGKLLNLNWDLDQYIECVRWYLLLQIDLMGNIIHKIQLSNLSNSLSTRLYQIEGLLREKGWSPLPVSIWRHLGLS